MSRRPLDVVISKIAFWEIFIFLVLAVFFSRANPPAPTKRWRHNPIALTRSLGKELATKGVLVNAVTPTTVNTPILAQVSQQHIDYMKSKIPMGRLGEAEELAAMITWLCTEDCSFSTAAVFDASGGRTTY